MMCTKFLLFLMLILAFQAWEQKSPAEELLDQSIRYHDPKNNWPKFSDSLIINQEVPGKTMRNTRMFIDQKESLFSHAQYRNDTLFTRIVRNGECTYQMNQINLRIENAEKLGLTCDRSKILRNYYTFLYGLPMKLKDPGTILDPEVTHGTFNDQEVDILKVNYDPSVGKDTWYFYFSPENHALVGYRFYHDESKNDGEYILLNGEKVIGEIKIPARRTWYVNSDDRLLGTDFLQ